MADTTFTLKALLDYSNIQQGLQKIQAELVSMGQRGKATKLGAMSSEAKALTVAIRQSQKEVQKLQQLQEQFSKKPGLTRVKDIQDAQTRKAIRGQQGPLGQGKNATEAQVTAALDAAIARTVAYQQALDGVSAGMTALAQQARLAWSQISQETAAGEQVLNRAAQLTGGGVQKNVSLGLVKQLDEEMASIRNQMQDLDQAAAKQGTEKQLKSYRGVTNEIAKANAHRAKARDITVEMANLEAKIATRGTGITEKEATQLKALDAERARQQKLQREALDRAEKPQQQQQTRKEQAGTAGAYRQLEQNLQRLQALREKAFDPATIAAQYPQLARQLQVVNDLQKAYAQQGLSIKRQKELMAELTVETRKLEKAQQAAIKGGGVKPGQGAFNQKEHLANLAKMRPGIDRLFEGIFSDMSRRFVATLQFSISAAIIFGAQRLAKEFVQAAIEVERAFADIATALEYDIQAPKGSIEFRRRVEEIRLQVLGLANDFNILPSEANEAAYVMISRFNETSNALVALKAQLLATKVSGIEQGEVLRALTATAEGFAASVFTVNDGLSLQAKLIQRESIAAKTYGKALDNAVLIQQKFGVETEDTLEGTARATEGFRQMGFTMEETNAIVASTARQLGQTGQQVAERLNRSLLQLTDPKIRDGLLDLAASSDAFNLSVSDFGSGAQAWETIVDQYERLSQADPAAAQKLLQIIGQRRELEAVAAALGTADLQKEMEIALTGASGAAEKRFKELSRTTEEILASIAAQFQSLAQSFQVLGGLSSIQILLRGLESFLTILGKILDMLIWVRDAVDDFLNVGVASWLVRWTLIAGSVATVLRLVLALKRAYVDLAKWGAVSSALNFFKGGSFSGLLKARTAAGGAGILPTLTNTTTLGRSAAGLAPGVAGPIAPGGALSGVTAALASPGVAFAAAAASAIVVGLALKSTADRANALNQSLTDGAKSMNEAAVSARRQAEAQNLSADATLRLMLTEQLAAAQTAAGAAPSGVPGVLDWVGAVWQDIPQPLSIASKGRDQSSRIASTFAAAFNPQNEAGSREQWKERIDKIQQELLTSEIDALNEANKGVAAEVDITHLDRDQKDHVQRVQHGVAAALDKAAALTLDALTGRHSQAERDALYAEAASLVALATYKHEELLEQFGTQAQRLSNSVNGWMKVLGNIDTDIALGQQTTFGGAALAKEAAAELYKIAEQFRDIGNNEDADDTFAKAREAELQGYNLQKQTLDNQVASYKVYYTGREAIRKEMDALRQFLQTVPIGSAAWNEAMARLLQLQVDLHDANLDATRAQYDHQVAMAKNFEESQAARRELYQQILRQIERTRDHDKQDELQREADKLEQDIIKDEYDNRTKVLQAQKRLSGPIFSQVLKIQSEVIAQQRIINNQFSDYADKLQAQIRLKELYAQMQLYELSRLKALKISNISVRDSMSGMQIELSALRREAELAAQNYGATSQEAAEAATAVKNAEAQIVDAVLELESVNRQLSPDYDITNPLHAAEEAYIKAARALQIPDLGAVERAAAELELKNAEAALVQAQYNDKLFDLRFLHESGKLGTNAYIGALKGMLAEVDTSTHQGKQLWIQINSLIEGLTSDIAGQAFNIPGQIRIPTLFEVRRAVQAEALGVNYQDNRQQDINVYVSDEVGLEALMETISGVFEVEQSRFAPGGAGITLGI